MKQVFTLLIAMIMTGCVQNSSKIMGTVLLIHAGHRAYKKDDQRNRPCDLRATLTDTWANYPLSTKLIQNDYRRVETEEGVKQEPAPVFQSSYLCSII